MDRPEFLQERYGADVYEHEIFMSFVNDEDAVKFYEWFSGQGWEQFQEFVDEYEQIREGGGVF